MSYMQQIFVPAKGYFKKSYGCCTNILERDIR